MISFDWVRVFPIYPKGLNIVWELRGAGVPGKYKFTIFRSSNAHDWEQIGECVNTFEFIDSNNLSATKQLQLYYKVIGVSPTNETFSSDAIVLFNKPEKRIFLTAQEIVRRGNILHEELNGVELAILKKKRWGDHCSKCYNPILDEILVSKCKSCYGTKWVGGYFSPIFVYGHVSPISLAIRDTVDYGKSERADTNITLMNYPLVQKDDLIVELASNDRWFVNRTQTTELKRYPVRQLVQASLIERTDISYDIPIRRPTKEV